MIKFIIITILVSNLFGIDRWNSKHTKISEQANLTNVLTRDNLISVILYTPINSHLDGKVIATVENDNYANHGSNIIIPKGSKAIGKYKALDTFSQERLVLIWQVIITPDGRIIKLNGATTTDATGQSGAVGELDHRYWDRYGLSLTTSTLTNLAGMVIIKETKSNEEESDNEAKNKLIADYAADSKSIVQQILKEQLTIKPVIIIKKGTRLFISPLLDISY
jgi:type IV secretory pathway VirB10-like protein